MMYRLFTKYSIVLFFSTPCFGQVENPSPEAKKSDTKKQSVFEGKQAYQPLSPFKQKKPKKAKTIDQLSKKQKKYINSLEKKLKKDSENISVRKKLARKYFNNKMFQSVVDTLMEYNHELDKVDRLILSRSLEKRNMHKEQIKVLKSISDENSEDFKTFYELGRVYYILRDADAAIDNLRTSILLNKNYFPSYRDLQKLFVETENNYENRELLTTMVNRFGEKPNYMTQLCKLYSLDNFHETAIRYCNRAYRTNKQDRESLSYLGMNYEKDGQGDLAKKSHKIAARKYKDSEFAQWAAGDWFFNKQNYHVSLKYFRKALKVDINSSRAALGAALSSFELKKYRNALALFSKACKLDKKLTVPQFQVATAKTRSIKDYDLLLAYESAFNKCRHNALR